MPARPRTTRPFAGAAQGRGGPRVLHSRAQAGAVPRGRGLCLSPGWLLPKRGGFRGKEPMWDVPVRPRPLPGSQPSSLGSGAHAGCQDLVPPVRVASVAAVEVLGSRRELNLGRSAGGALGEGTVSSRKEHVL